jgi:hypothetical protein
MWSKEIRQKTRVFILVIESNSKNSLEVAYGKSTIDFTWLISILIYYYVRYGNIFDKESVVCYHIIETRHTDEIFSTNLITIDHTISTNFPLSK